MIKAGSPGPRGARHGVVLFPTSASALRAERLFSPRGYPTRLVPSPRRFTSDCGMALRFPWDRKGEVEETLKASSIDFSAIHLL